MDVSKVAYHHPKPWDMPIAKLSVPDMFARSVAASPDAPLAEFMGRTFSYRQIHAQARHFAAALQAMGYKKGDRIGLFLPNVPAYIAAYYGAMIAGATVVNFSPLYSVDELAHQVEDSGTQLLVTLDVASLLPTALEVLEKSSLERLVVTRLSEALPTVKGVALRLLGRKQLAPIPKRDDVLRWADIVTHGEPLKISIDPEADIALLQYTGGTTGTPKGAMLSHANLTANAQQVDGLDPFEDRDVILGVLPFFHVFANTCVLNRTVLKRGCISMLPRFDAKDALKTIDRVKPTSFPGVPTMYQALLDHERIGKTDFSSLKVCISGGAALSAPTRENFEAVSGARVVEGYGLTESSGVVSANPYVGARQPGTIGQVLPGTLVRLLDKEDPTRPAPDGEPGELIVNGPQVMQGYWNRPEADKDVFVELDGERWLRTGDIAVIGEDGFIQIVDRSKDMISVGGFKVFPSQVENVLVDHPAVKEALVIGMPEDYRGEVPRAFVTLNEGSEIAAQDIAKWLNERIGKHQRVDKVVIREELPKTMIGKLDRKALRAEVIDD
ncbi:long-chain fatty acid--CoA ligase [Erythrobacter sp. HKB08]|uniref:long-chain-fatty-acid--CoA ligase n=1 Tax=Erythrobacter sp. HKB08 TaxID=2502843 RepID=UPI0010088106|nr:long-chain fatty acid--CoA ligase [Erythrobacter sp. HKB08]